MTFLQSAKRLMAGAVTVAALGLGSAQAADTFDLSPEQPNRLRVEKNEKRIEQVKDFKFVADGRFHGRHQHQRQSSAA